MNNNKQVDEISLQHDDNDIDIDTTEGLRVPFCQLPDAQ